LPAQATVRGRRSPTHVAREAAIFARRARADAEASEARAREAMQNAAEATLRMIALKTRYEQSLHRT